MTDIVRDTIAALIAAEKQKIPFPSPPLGYGVDLVCASDVDPNMRETSGDTIASLAQDCFHRVTTPRGSLDDDPNFGFDVRALLSVGLTTAYVRSLESQLSGELQKDDRVQFAACLLAQSGQSRPRLGGSPSTSRQPIRV